MGIRDRPISPRSPWQNPYVERLTGTLRRECLDHVLIYGERHLRRVLSLYSLYYNETRTHLGLAKDAPLRRAVQRSGTIVTKPNGHAAAPPSSLMNSRLLLRNSIKKIPVESMSAVSSIRVRSAHGNSFDHLVDAGDQRQRNGKAEGLGSFQVDDQLDFGGLLDRQIGGLLALENLGGVATGQAV